MKIIKNIGPFYKLKRVLEELTPYEKEILEKRKKGDLEGERRAILACSKRWSGRMVETFEMNIQVEGKENLPEKGPVVFVGNHQGYADIIVCLYVLDGFQTGFVAKSSLSRIPFYGRWIENIRSVFIKREDSRASLKAIQEGIQLLEQGFSLVIFPEGTRSRKREMRSFRKGSLRLATKPEVLIVPFTIDGSYKVFEETGVLTNGATIRFVIHPPVETKELTRSQIKQLDDQIENTVRGGLSSQ
jgi:1-acyl-sn-glycerol-3-phosphate acyltransferase